jgi:phosphoribosylformimino-5-aminoimidazole carboxamide ribotide isomerase
VAQVIVGTRAILEPEVLSAVAAAFPQQVILGLDARDGRLATAGWDQTSATRAIDYAAWAGSLDIAAIVYTDIDRDGMLGGLNVDATVAVAEAAGLPVIASGGVSDLDDLRALMAAFRDSSGVLMGAITGRAIYEGTLDLAAGQALLDESGSPGR